MRRRGVQYKDDTGNDYMAHDLNRVGEAAGKELIRKSTTRPTISSNQQSI